MKLHWYLLSLLAALCFALPAEATRLLFWDFDRDRNRLSFTTDSGVRPSIRMIPNPTRLVIDLPGTRVGGSNQQRVGGAIANVRVGQPNSRTTRIVVELAPGYSLDPREVNIEGYPSQWNIQLPEPQRGNLEGNLVAIGVPDWFRITNNGFFIRLEGRGEPEELKVERGADGMQIDIEVEGRVQGADPSETFSVDRYGVESVRFAQLGNTARITLRLAANSPRWEVSGDRGGLTIVPEAGSEILRSQRPQTRPTPREIVIPVPPPSPPSPRDRDEFPRPRGGVLVVVDPGHGGKDPGAIGIGGLQEKDVVLPISLEIAQILRDRGVNVIMTRQDDRFISLQGRTYIANRARADLFASIHANAVGGYRPEVNGMETYYYSASGYRFAQVVHQTILETVPVARNRGVKRARFYVLRNSAMPAILVEVGFVTGQIDAPNLANPAYRSQMAQAIALGILRYIE